MSGPGTSLGDEVLIKCATCLKLVSADDVSAACEACDLLVEAAKLCERCWPIVPRQDCSGPCARVVCGQCSSTCSACTLWTCADCDHICALDGPQQALLAAKVVLERRSDELLRLQRALRATVLGIRDAQLRVHEAEEVALAARAQEAKGVADERGARAGAAAIGRIGAVSIGGTSSVPATDAESTPVLASEPTTTKTTTTKRRRSGAALVSHPK
jgi:hypothetical protein